MTTDPTTLAHEVLAIQDRHRALNARTGLDLPIDINDMATLASAAPALASAVLSLTERVRVAQELHQSAGEQMDDYGYTYEACRACDSAWPCDTSTALNGDTP